MVIKHIMLIKLPTQCGLIGPWGYWKVDLSACGIVVICVDFVSGEYVVDIQVAVVADVTW